MRKHTFFIVLITLFIFAGCSGATDYSINLPGNLKVSKISANNIVIESHDSVGIGTSIIPSRITQVGWDDNYVIAEQTQEEKEFYWIIEVKTTDVIGPLKYKDFLKNKSEIQISDDVKLKDLDEYRKDYDF